MARSLPVENLPPQNVKSIIENIENIEWRAHVLFN